ncbi:hypothetical protein IMZ48_39395 [Candidatus Bathyarchaeota archaeon]|nr:hypothetical protein [Candidatus Bathyarchaeota archaeon]
MSAIVRVSRKVQKRSMPANGMQEYAKWKKRLAFLEVGVELWVEEGRAEVGWAVGRGGGS